MSLRDALLSKGLVSKKDVDRVQRELREQRKADQGSRRGKAEEAREAEAARVADQEERRRAAQEARRAEAAAREAHEHALRVRQIVGANRLAGRGPVPFHYRVPGTSRVGRLMLPEALCRDLRNGGAAIAVLTGPDGAWEPVVVTRRAAEKLATVEPGALAHWVGDGKHLADPAEGLMRREWDSDLRPHRVRTG